MESKIEKKREKSFTQYIIDKHTQEECIGFIDGYEQALKDSKAPEMFEMLKFILNWSSVKNGKFKFETSEERFKELEQLLKEATEL